eukprot:TRINITY_DN2443_c0_g1_i1.p1 TRINITY_DN2443_c0_g1~~TRINITY_DN2443_c0_g1_i1.p1  ORF type:complete len:356 (-),score=84.12 TRINITY_DN2443_c0_g1_i1:72-1139(-)
MKTVLVVCFVLCLAGYGLAASCNNTLFNNRNDWWNLVFTPEPIDNNDDLGICKHLRSGPQCCSPKTYEKVTEAWTKARDNIANTVTIWQEQRAKFIADRTKWESLRKNITNSLLIPDDQKQKINDLFDNIYNALDDFTGKVIGNWADCSRGILKYWAGLFCYGCDANWDKYVVVDEQRGIIYLNISSSTCNNLRGDCQPFWVLFGNLANNIQKALAEFASIPAFNPDFDNIVDHCDGDCGKWICDTFFHGLDYDVDALPSATGKRFASQLESVNHALESASDERDFVFDRIDSIASAVNHMTTVTKNIRANSYTVKNTYSDSDGTYDAYATGEDSGLDVHVSSAAALNNWFATLF